MSNNDEFLELIPQETPQGTATYPDYRMLRAPLHIREICPRNPKTILSDNGVRMYVPPSLFEVTANPGDFSMSFSWKDNVTERISCKVAGPSKEAILETALMLWNLPGSHIMDLTVSNSDELSPEDLLNWFEMTSPTYPVFFYLNHGSFEFASIGRNKNHYKLHYDGENHIENFLKTISRMKNVLTLTLHGGLSAKDSCLALSLPVPLIKIELREDKLQGEELRSVNILAKCVSISFVPLPQTEQLGSYPLGNIPAWFLRQLALSKCLIRLEFKYDGTFGTDIPDDLANLLVRIIKANQNLDVLQFTFPFEHGGRWDKHVHEVLSALKQNRGLCSVNENLVPSNPVSIDSKIDNHFFDYKCSLRLAQEPHAVRQALVGKALSEWAVDSFLLSHLFVDTHTDSICELLQESLSSFQPIQIQPPPAASKRGLNPVTEEPASSHSEHKPKGKRSKPEA